MYFKRLSLQLISPFQNELGMLKQHRENIVLRAQYLIPGELWFSLRPNSL